MGEPGASQGGTVQVRTGQVKTSQAGQASTGQNGQGLLGTRVWPYSVLCVFWISGILYILLLPSWYTKYNVVTYTFFSNIVLLFCYYVFYNQ